MLVEPLANRILYLGARLPDFTEEIVALVVLGVCALFGPLLVFAPQLAAAKRAGLGEYDTLAERYVREFDAKCAARRRGTRRAAAWQLRYPVARRPGEQL